MSLSEVVLIGLATYRLSYLLTLERGMFGVAEWLRRIAGVEYISTQNEIAPGYTQTDVECTGRNELARLLCCPLCTSVWLALILMLLYRVAPWFVGLLAISGVSVISHKFGERP